MKTNLLLLSFMFLLISCKGKKDHYLEPELITVPVEQESDHGSMENTLAKTGMEIAEATQQELGKNLIKAIGEGGLVFALEFCYVEAIPLTSQMEKERNTVIKRVSDRNRNPDNAANKEEENYIREFQKNLEEGKEPAPIVISKGEENNFYYPIITNKMCLQCHGKPEEMNPEVLQKIKVLYPGDKALGYSENEVRGIWSIQLD